MSQDPFKYFRVEARELLTQLGSGALELERENSNPGLIQKLLRLAHTLKGAARVVKQPEIAEEAHAIEDALAPFRQVDVGVPPERIEVLLGFLDRIGQRLGTLSPPESIDTGPARSAAPEAESQTVRADLTDMDTLLDGVTETHTQLTALRKKMKKVERIRALANLLPEQLRPGPASAQPGGDGRDVGRSGQIAEEIRATCEVLERGMGDAVEQMARELKEIRDMAEHMRLVPVKDLFAMLERAVRDVAQTQGKHVAFEGRGGDVRIDSHVLGAVQGALLQIVRNSVAHGIEAEATRAALGKPAAGRVIVGVLRRDRWVVFRCEDDGQGVDVEAVRRAVIRRGAHPRDVDALGAEELMQCLLRGGISTSPVVTEVSGRGIGLDIARETAERLGGQVTVRTQPNRGTTFELIVPLSLTSIEALVAESSGFAVGIPLDAVKRTIRLGADNLSRTPQGDSVVFENHVIPFLSLSRLFGKSSPAGREASSRSAVIIEGSDGLAALGVERLLGAANVVLRPIPVWTPDSPVAAGVCLDADGNPQLVLDAGGLVKQAINAGAAERGPVATAKSILVIDDSMTTRMLEQSILESAGYDVDVAISGEAALAAAGLKRYGLFLVDVEMPGMDGFTFVESVRSNPDLRHVPAMLVTSRSAPEDRERGRNVGAQGYIVKSEFDQSDFLATVKRLVR